jgi:ferredoxin
MIITKQKNLKDILSFLDGAMKIFIVGCGECSKTCKTGGEDEVIAMKSALEKAGKVVTGWCVPKSPCVAASVKLSLAKERKGLEEAQAILVLACGLGIQCIKENLRVDRDVHVGCDTLFMGAIDASGAFLEKCSACGDCIIETTALICPVTRCPKSLQNGPCGGQRKGKCEVDKDRDCVWITIYNELKKKGREGLLRQKRAPKDHSKNLKPRGLNPR